MKERPILFSAPMVRAIIEGRKTVTRRVVKPRPEHRHVVGVGDMLAFKKPDADEYWLYPNAKDEVVDTCPYGKPGDRLWVRETWGTGGYSPYPYAYRADGKEYPGERWKPSIFMPRRASRITLEVTGVRVERLQSMTDADAIAEDCAATSGCKWHTALDAFSALWESINGEGSWNTNPWVWVVDFKRLPGAGA